MKPKSNLSHWVACGIPVQIASWCDSLAEKGKSSVYRDRINRFSNYLLDTDLLARSWKTIANNAKSDEELIRLFMVMPDGPVSQPFPAIYGYRTIDPGEEKRRYDELLKCAKAIYGLRKYQRFSNFIADATTTEAGSERIVAFREAEVGFFDGLRKLMSVLEVIDPAAKIPTAHWASVGADQKNYVILLSGLNRYLRTPKWKALATLANINCPSHTVSADALAKAWKNGADKRC